MSADSQFDDFSGHEASPGAPAAKRGWSTGAKVALILGGCVGLLMLLCCGFFGYMGFKVSKSMTVEPAAINAIRDTVITSIDLPPEFKPQMGMDLTLAGQGMKMVMFGDSTDPQQGGTVLMLMQMMVAADEAQMRRELEKSMGSQQKIQIESSETKTLTVDGTMIDFLFAKGKMQDKAVRQVTGVFAGKTGTVMLMLFVPEEKWDESKVIGILESLKK